MINNRELISDTASTLILNYVCRASFFGNCLFWTETRMLRLSREIQLFVTPVNICATLSAIMCEHLKVRVVIEAFV